MAPEDDAPGLSFEMHTVSSRRLRLRALLLQVRRPPLLALLVFIALGPALGDRFLALLIPAPPLSLGTLFFAVPFLLVGAFLVVLITILRPTVTRTVRFEEAGILDTVAGRPPQRREWSWVQSFTEEADLLHLECGVPLRSLRLGGSLQRFVLRKGPETMPLELLLARKVRDRSSTSR